MRPVRYAAELTALTALYVVAARWGLGLGAVAGFATLVWPPTGIALAAVLLRGYRMWPAIAAGAVIANVWMGAPLPVALGIGVGNTLEPMLGAYALRRIPGFQPSLDRLVDVLGLIVLAGVMSTVVAATVGVTSLFLGGIVAESGLALAWRTWWLGDLIGAILVAPAILVWASSQRAVPQPHRLAETLLLAITIVVVSLLIFAVPATRESPLQTYVLFPPLIWAALRFGKRGAVTSALAVSAIAVWGTARGHGSFVESTLYESLLALQTFMGVVAATFLILGTSISERRRAHEELRQARENAEAANRAKAEFLAVVSHELRTPLNAITGYVELLHMQLAGPMNQQQSDAVARIQRSAQHLLALIEDILSFARIEAGRLPLSRGNVSIPDALVEVEALIAPDLSRRSITLESDTSNPELRACADPEKLRQVLLNVVGNAIKFTDPGGRVTIVAARNGDDIQIRISDTGIGVPADKLDRVFEPFFQVEGGTTRRYPGVGLGLAIARDLTLAMRGELRMESTEGRGSTVWLTLPAA